jgi:hypothetical protein
VSAAQEQKGADSGAAGERGKSKAKEAIARAGKPAGGVAPPRGCLPCSPAVSRPFPQGGPHLARVPVARHDHAANTGAVHLAWPPFHHRHQGAHQGLLPPSPRPAHQHTRRPAHQHTRRPAAGRPPAGVVVFFSTLPSGGACITQLRRRSAADSPLSSSQPHTSEPPRGDASGSCRLERFCGLTWLGHARGGHEPRLQQGAHRSSLRGSGPRPQRGIPSKRSGPGGGGSGGAGEGLRNSTRLHHRGNTAVSPPNLASCSPRVDEGCSR